MTKLVTFHHHWADRECSSKSDCPAIFTIISLPICGCLNFLIWFNLARRRRRREESYSYNQWISEGDHREHDDQYELKPPTPGSRPLPQSRWGSSRGQFYWITFCFMLWIFCFKIYQFFYCLSLCHNLFSLYWLSLHIRE